MADAPRATVLVIDDEEAHRELVAILLQREGVDVLHAANGAEGLEAAREKIPDLVLLDVFMPGDDGFDVLQVMKADTGSPKVLIFSVLENPTSEARARELGADGYVVKPFDMNKMVATVLEHLGLEPLAD